MQWFCEGDPATTTAINFNTDKEYGATSGFSVGSTYKLFTLIDWLQNGHGIQDTVNGNIQFYPAGSKSFPATCDGGFYPLYKSYRPENDSGVSQGQMSVLNATKDSVNAAFINMGPPRCTRGRGSARA